MLRIIASVFVALCGAFGVADAAAQQDDQNTALAVSQPEIAMSGEVDALERLYQPPASVQYSEISGEGGVLLERISQAAQFHQIARWLCCLYTALLCKCLGTNARSSKYTL